MNLDRAPFRVIPMQQPASVGEDVVAAFACLSLMPERTLTVFTTLMKKLGVPAEDPVSIAGLALARDIDSGGGGGHPHPYHNTRHFCEVMLCAHMIAQHQRLSSQAAAEVVLAALMHDYGHDGRPNGPTPFRLERQSVTMASKVFEGAGVSGGCLARVVAMVLATDVARGHRYALRCHEAHDSIVIDMPTVPPEAPELQLLAASSGAARQALVLCEADVLPSVGLTFGHALKMQAELSAEWDTVLDEKDKIRFIDAWLDHSVMSLFFKPNVQALRRRLATAVMQASP